MAGYPGTPLATKIGIKDEHVVLLDAAPEDLDLATGAARVVRRLPALVDAAAPRRPLILSAGAAAVPRGSRAVAAAT